MENEERTWRENRQNELEAAYLYRRMAASERNGKLRELYLRMADIECRHADVWERKLAGAGITPGEFRPGMRTRILGWISAHLGNAAVVESVNNTEMDAGRDYRAQGGAEALAMAADEQAHAASFRSLADDHEGAHGNAGGNTLRAGVMGANDGLVSNFSLVMGMAGVVGGGAAASGEGSTLLATGLAGLLAGAISMAMGEWLSVQSSRELYERQMALEKAELESNPEEEIEELALIYEAKGMGREEALGVARRLAERKGAMLDTLAREELGIDPEELGGSAWGAAGVSFLLFSVGAVIPVLPFFFMKESLASVALSAALSLAGLFGLGAATTLMTGRSVLFAGSRQVLFGILASAVTFVIGHFIGVQLG